MNIGFKSRNLFRALFGGLVFFMAAMAAKRTARGSADGGCRLLKDVQRFSLGGSEEEGGKHESGNHVLLLG